MNRTTAQLEQQLGHPPTDEEVAAQSKLNSESVEFLHLVSSRTQSLNDSAYPDEADRTLEDIVEAPGLDPGEMVTDRATHLELYTVIRELPEPEQRVIATLYLDGTDGSVHKTARILSLSLKEVRRLQASALAHLHEALSGEPTEATEYLQPVVDRESLATLRNRVWELKRENPDLTFVQIADRLGIHQRRASAYYHEKCAELEAAD